MHVKITRQSGIYTLTSEQILPVTMEVAWEFFTLPTNLDKITPAEMKFFITNNPGPQTYPGQIITYKIGIFPFIKNNWITEITHFRNPSGNGLQHAFFVDEQRFGPYAMWHHEHHFEELENGRVKMTDVVNFKLPFGILGDIIAGKAVLKKVRSIFESRHRILNELFRS